MARDAALRGLSVALVEKGDFGHATSANSLRVIHGGLRYLASGDIRRMRRSIRERKILMQIAPHLVHPLPFLIPAYSSVHLVRSKTFLSTVLKINELVSFDRNTLEDPQKQLPRGRVISREECLRLVPGIDEKDLTGGIIFYDCQISNSERLTLATLWSAADAGADLANYVEATGFLGEKDCVTGITARDVLTGDDLEIQAKIVINTSGPWLNRVLSFIKGDQSPYTIVLSRAFNLLINRQLIPEYAVAIWDNGC